MRASSAEPLVARGSRARSSGSSASRSARIAGSDSSRSRSAAIARAVGELVAPVAAVARSPDPRRPARGRPPRRSDGGRRSSARRGVRTARSAAGRRPRRDPEPSTYPRVKSRSARPFLIDTCLPGRRVASVATWCRRCRAREVSGRRGDGHGRCRARRCARGETPRQALSSSRLIARRMNRAASALLPPSRWPSSCSSATARSASIADERRRPLQRAVGERGLEPRDGLPRVVDRVALRLHPLPERGPGRVRRGPWLGVTVARPGTSRRLGQRHGRPARACRRDRRRDRRRDGRPARPSATARSCQRPPATRARARSCGSRPTTGRRARSPRAPAPRSTNPTRA